MTDDLKMMMNKLKFFLNDQYVNYNDDLEKSKTCMFQDLHQISIFHDLYDFVTSFAL
jgi:ribosome-associated protein YbcJ (S4-like RNA binding protein)